MTSLDGRYPVEARHCGRQLLLESRWGRGPSGYFCPRVWRLERIHGSGFYHMVRAFGCGRLRGLQATTTVTWPLLCCLGESPRGDPFFLLLPDHIRPVESLYRNTIIRIIIVDFYLVIGIARVVARVQYTVLPDPARRPDSRRRPRKPVIIIFRLPQPHPV